MICTLCGTSHPPTCTTPHTAQDGKTLQECGISQASRVLVSAAARGGGGASGPPELEQQEARMAQLDKVKRVMRAFAARDGTRGGEDQLDLTLENQASLL